MRFIALNSNTLPASELLVVPLRAKDLKGNEVWSLLPTPLNRQLPKELKRCGFQASSSETFSFSVMNSHVTHILVVGAEAEKTSSYDTQQRARRLGATIQAEAQRRHAKTITLLTHSGNFDRHATALLEGMKLAQYSFLRYKSNAKEKSHAPSSLSVWPTKLNLSPASAMATAVSDGVCLARDLVNTPALDCPPAALVKAARALARTRGVSAQIFDRKQLKRLGAGALLAVAQGSSQPPYLISLKVQGRRKTGRSIALVGKGVTFDSGGLSIKTASGMETMKYDMAGAAAVLGTMAALARLKPDVEVRGYIPTAENMISGDAIRPGDIVRAMSGKTIEILNTDAEGRLLLADALHFASRDKPKTIIDLATLTGACRIALGLEYAALFSEDDTLCQKLMKASEEAGERLWRMPLAPEYKALIKSNLADIKNTGGSYGGAITAALFLKEFVGKIPWAHLDIAGPAYSESDRGYIKKGGVGFGVGTLVRYIISQ